MNFFLKNERKKIEKNEIYNIKDKENKRII